MRRKDVETDARETPLYVLSTSSALDLPLFPLRLSQTKPDYKLVNSLT